MVLILGVIVNFVLSICVILTTVFSYLAYTELKKLNAKGSNEVMKLRPLTDEEIEEYRYDPDKPCAACSLKGKEVRGSYRTSEYYLCKKHMKENLRVEDDDTN